MGRWGDGEMGRWGDGEMGRWGACRVGKNSLVILIGHEMITLPTVLY
ncbi:hypothetical protein [Moorena producens]